VNPASLLLSFFVPVKVDDIDEPPTEISHLKNPLKKATKDNSEKKQLLAIETFTENGAFIVIILKKLQTDIFEHLGITNVNKKVDEQLDYLLQVNNGCTRGSWFHPQHHQTLLH
jgi:hypothetical protein